MSPGRNALVGSFDVVSAAPCRLAAASLGDGARQRRVRCITLWPRLLQWPPRLLLGARVNSGKSNTYIANVVQRIIGGKSRVAAKPAPAPAPATRSSITPAAV